MTLLGGSLSAYYCPLLRIIHSFLMSVLSMHLAKCNLNNKLTQDGEARIYQNPDFLARYFCSAVFIPEVPDKDSSVIKNSDNDTKKSHALCYVFEF
jgi:hypothetical protein